MFVSFPLDSGWLLVVELMVAFAGVVLETSDVLSMLVDVIGVMELVEFSDTAVCEG